MYTQLLEKIKDSYHPSIQSRKVAIFIHQQLTNKNISVYEGYILNLEKTKVLKEL